MKFYFKIFTVLKDYKFLFFILTVIASLQSILNILSVIFLGYVVSIVTSVPINFEFFNFILYSKFNYEQITPNILILIFALLIFLLSLINLFIHFYSTKIKYTVIAGYLYKSLNLILNSTSSFFSKYDKGKLLNSYARELDKMASGISSFALIIPLIFQFLVFIIFPFIIDFKLAVIIYASILAISLTVIPLSKLAKLYGKKNTITGNYFIKILEEIFSFNQFIISHNKQKLILDRIIKKYIEHYSYALKSTTLDASPQIILPNLIILILSIILFLSSFSIDKHITEISMIIFSLFRGLPIMSALFSYHLKIHTFSEAFSQLENINRHALKYTLQKGNILVNSVESINFQNLYFKYDDNHIIKDFSLKFQKGKIYLLEGESGSGKSTLIQLITGFKIPTLGKIIINNKYQLNKLDIDYFRTKISYLTQDSVIFNATLKENITLFDESIPDLKVKETLNLVKLGYLIDRLDDPLNLVINNVNSNLSGGEKQRIAIARLLLQDSQVVLLDEITSSLDRNNSEVILKIIKNISQNKIVIVVSHDPLWLNTNFKKIIIKRIS